jgi:hypothetical protein
MMSAKSARKWSITYSGILFEKSMTVAAELVREAAMNGEFESAPIRVPISCHSRFKTSMGELGYQLQCNSDPSFFIVTWYPA